MIKSILNDTKLLAFVLAVEAVVAFSLFVIAHVLDELWFSLGYYFQFGLTVAAITAPILWWKRRRRSRSFLR